MEYIRPTPAHLHFTKTTIPTSLFAFKKNNYCYYDNNNNNNKVY